MLASIFIASIVATVWPAATASPSATCSVTTPANGAATCRALPRSAFSAALTSVATSASRTDTGRSCPFSDVDDRAVAALVGLGDRLQLDDQRDAGLELHGVLDLGLQPVEEVLRGEHRRVAVRLAVGQVLLRRPGEQQPVQRRAAVLRAGLPGRRRTARRAPARADGLPAPGCGRAPASRPAGRRARRAGSRSRSRARRTCRDRPRSPSPRRPRPTRCSARSPTTFDDGVTFTSRPSIRSAAA